MKIYVPELGDVFVLTEEWNFNLYLERRNAEAWEKIKGKKLSEDWWRHHSYETSPKPDKVALPVGTKLTVDRIYIRKGKSEYSSLSFRGLRPDDKKTFRFWVKLQDVNNINADVVRKEEIF